MGSSATEPGLFAQNSPRQNESLNIPSARNRARSMQQGNGLAIRRDTRVVRGILLDLDGVVRDTLLPGSLEAISKIEAAGIRLKFITNTTRRPRRRIAADLTQLGLR